MPGNGTFEIRYSTLNLKREGDVWQDANSGKGKNKRLRRSSGGTSDHQSKYRGPEAGYRGHTEIYLKMSKNEFLGLSTDEKPVTMFEDLTEIGSLSGIMQNVESKVGTQEIINVAHNERIQEYRYGDQEPPK